jgi:hypothetical protein
VEASRRGITSIVVCSSAFLPLGRSQLAAMGCPDIPIAVVPHPFGLRTRSEVRAIAEGLVGEIARLAAEGVPEAAAGARRTPPAQARRIEFTGDLEDFQALSEERRWGDGLPLVPPTPERVERMLASTRRAPDVRVATLAPGFGTATVEAIAVNSVMAGSRPEYLPVVIAAVEAVADRGFNLQGIQATTNAAAPWIIVSGPLAQRLGINAGLNCLGSGRARERHHRSCAAARPAEHRRRTPRETWIGPRTASPASTPSAARRTRAGVPGSRCTWNAAMRASRAP